MKKKIEQKKRYETFISIKARIEKGESVTFAERNLYNIECKMRAKKQSTKTFEKISVIK